jgi:hypothetical protein
MALTDIEKFINDIPQSSIDYYTSYWESITPVTDTDYYNRWLFAFLSVHTSWRSNVRSYKQITSECEIPDKLKLRDLIIYSKIGLVEMRTKGVWQFKENFYQNPQQWRKQSNETWDQFRDRTMNMCHGIGYAKTAFAIELCYPNECEVTCLDTHMLKLYGYSKTSAPTSNKYKSLEKHWIDTCRHKKIPAFMARNAYWDMVQQRQNTRYWSYVFEPRRIK